MKCYQTNLSPMKVFFDINDLTYFHKIINNQIPLNIPEYIKPYTGQSRLRQINLDDMSMFVLIVIILVPSHPADPLSISHFSSG